VTTGSEPRCGNPAASGRDVEALNALNNFAEESVATDNFFSQHFGQGVAFVDPRRALESALVALSPFGQQSGDRCVLIGYRAILGPFNF